MTGVDLSGILAGRILPPEGGQRSASHTSTHAPGNANSQPHQALLADATAFTGALFPARAEDVMSLLIRLSQQLAKGPNGPLQDLSQIFSKAAVDPSDPQAALSRVFDLIASILPESRSQSSLLRRLQSALNSYRNEAQATHSNPLPENLVEILEKAIQTLAENKPEQQAATAQGGTRGNSDTTKTEGQASLQQKAATAPESTDKQVTPQKGEGASTHTTGKTTDQGTGKTAANGTSTPAMDPQAPALPRTEQANAHRIAKALVEAEGGTVSSNARTGSAEATQVPLPSLVTSQTQLSGPLPLILDGHPVSAWLEMEWEGEVDPDQRGQGEDANGKKSGQSLSLNIASDTLGHISFRLAWLPNELVGTIAFDRPDVAAEALKELPSLERKLKENDAETVQLRVMAHQGGYGAES